MYYNLLIYLFLNYLSCVRTKGLVQDHKLSPHKDDFICKFLEEIDKRQELPKSFKEEQLLVALLDLFLSGSETSSSTLSFAILHLIENQHVQAKVYEEIMSVVGDGEICIADKKK